jgi:hypothetical protein
MNHSMTVEQARRRINALAGIRRRIERGQLTGRNGDATESTIRYHVAELRRFFAEADETAETARLYDRFNALERWSVGLPS